MRKTLKESKKKVTVMGILIKTFSLALKQYPRMNSVYDPQINPFEYTIHPNHNISIAIDSPNGLVVPHIKNVNNISLLNIQTELERLRNLASEAKLTAKELQGGTICLSNIGTIGGTHACPLILPPQICIVAIGKLQSVPKYRNGELSERKVLNVSFGCDHRVVDGATVARFSNAWKQLIENPYLSMAEMI
jgi:2-oxoisovalerate dehydrogenase E2 component (dihydrolipoyl transacylase)